MEECALLTMSDETIGTSLYSRMPANADLVAALRSAWWMSFGGCIGERSYDVYFKWQRALTANR